MGGGSAHAERPGGGSGFSWRRHCQWWGRACSPVGPPTIFLLKEEETKSEAKQEVARLRASWGGARRCAGRRDRGQCPEKDGFFVLCGRPAVWSWALCGSAQWFSLTSRRELSQAWALGREGGPLSPALPLGMCLRKPGSRDAWMALLSPILCPLGPCAVLSVGRLALPSADGGTWLLCPLRHKRQAHPPPQTVSKVSRPPTHDPSPTFPLEESQEPSVSCRMGARSTAVPSSQLGPAAHGEGRGTCPRLLPEGPWLLEGTWGRLGRPGAMQLGSTHVAAGGVTPPWPGLHRKEAQCGEGWPGCAWVTGNTDKWSLPPLHGPRVPFEKTRGACSGGCPCTSVAEQGGLFPAPWEGRDTVLVPRGPRRVDPGVSSPRGPAAQTSLREASAEPLLLGRTVPQPCPPLLVGRVSPDPRPHGTRSSHLHGVSLQTRASVCQS